MRMKRTLATLLCAALVALAAGVHTPQAFAQEAAPALPAPARPRIQIAILLDTSGSMEGLIGQAKTELWRIVNEFALARRDGVPPRLEVALYEYGNDSLPEQEGWMRMIVPLTDDLDRISEELFALTTNGGSEFCGQVIQQAVRELDWSESNADLKAIFIAGNEAFTQGRVDYREACKAAIAAGVVVNTIHCGPYQQGVDGHWNMGAELADGSYLSIDHNREAIHVEAPQDAEIARLGVLLNTTYVAYGVNGVAFASRQVSMDSLAAAAAPSAGVERQMAKASVHYRNSGWDLVDALEDGTCKVEDLKEAELPKELQGKSAAEIKAHVAAKGKERGEIKAKINALNAERRTFVEAKRQELAPEGEDTLDVAMVKVARAQAKARGFEFEATGTK